MNPKLNDSSLKKNGWLTDTRRAFITQLLVLLITPLSVAITIYFTQYYKSANPHIEFVKVSKVLVPIPPSDKIKSEILQNVFLTSNLVRGLQTFNSSTSIDWLYGYGKWDDSCQKGLFQAITYTEYILNDFDIYNKKSQAGGLGYMYPIIPEEKKRITESFAILNDLKSELQNAILQPKTPTGNVMFTVGVLNKGESDGVLYNTAILRCYNLSIPIYTENYISIKAHSFQSVTFVTSHLPIGEKINTTDQNNRRVFTNNIISQQEDTPYELDFMFNGNTVSNHGVIPK